MEEEEPKEAVRWRVVVGDGDEVMRGSNPLTGGGSRRTSRKDVDVNMEVQYGECPVFSDALVTDGGYRLWKGSPKSLRIKSGRVNREVGCYDHSPVLTMGRQPGSR